MGRYKFIHISPAGKDWVKETFSIASLKSVSKVIAIFAFMPFFWALYDQHGSSWVLQGQNMDRNIFGFQILAAQMQVLNPLLILIFIPLFTFVIYPAFAKFWPLTPLRRIGLGFFFAALSFLPVALFEKQIAAGAPPNILWQVLPYTLLAAGEVLASITALEFAYTQAPVKLKSLVMSLFLLTVAVGNQITARITALAKDYLVGPKYFLFFAFLMFITGIVFIFVARAYKEQTFLHDEKDAASA